MLDVYCLIALLGCVTYYLYAPCLRCSLVVAVSS
jgi:hypothetical protein